MDRQPPLDDSRNDPRELDHFRDRVRYYLLVLLAIDLAAYVSDLVMPLLVEGLVPQESSLLRRCVTAIVTCGVLVTRFARPPRFVLVALEGAVTIGLAVVYSYISSVHMSGDVESIGPLFGMFGIMLLLTVRSALVPSPVVRTVVVGAGAVLLHFRVANEAIRALDPSTLDGLVFIGGATVLASAVTSHVIYGLRREVREALRLGQYTLEDKLGEGGMGAVYRARHALLRRQAAIKLIRPELLGRGSGRDQLLQRFEREADVTANLKSPHTVELYDFGVSADGAFYYVMELLDGISLETLVSRYGPLPPERAVFLLRQVCDSLEEAHASGLVHRDIKPANLFVCRHGLRHDFVKVLDFGLVALGRSAEAADPKLTATGFAGGTPAYLAPESASGEGPVDGRADLYAVGCVAFWLLTGRPPFVRESSMATILAHVGDAPEPPSRVSELGIPEALDALILECLSKRPEERPASAAELSRRLRDAADPDGWDAERARRWWDLHRPAGEPARRTPDPPRPERVTRLLRAAPEASERNPE